MSWATAVFLIVLITAIAGVIRHRNEHRYLSDKHHQRSDRERQLEDEVEQLRDRIAVLERIATDGNSVDTRETQRIAAEIEALRNTQDDG